MAEYDQLCLAKGRLRIQAKGYWFTAGGGKGSFGYYPHLKDSDGYPVFPDTQIHGDFRMAAEWLNSIDPDIDASNYIPLVFGDQVRDTTGGLLYLTDLELSADSKSQWHPDRFQVKPRIAIDDDTRTVESHMLVDQEFSYLDKLSLESNIYLGYFDRLYFKDEELEKALDLINNSSKLLSGFGGFRSRGFGRGEITIEWTGVEKVAFDSSRTATTKNLFAYSVKSLTHFRNKPIEPGTSQAISSLKYIKNHQLRGWFARAFHSMFNRWPTPTEMDRIHFPDLYPSMNKLTYPPPMSTFMDEAGKTEDLWGYDFKRDPHKTEQMQQEDFIRTRLKPLPPECFVTNDPVPEVHRVTSEKRIRNAMDENFTTLEDGLFVQEFIKNGTRFSGIVTLEGPADRFLEQTLFIFNHVKPTIGNAIFEPSIDTSANIGLSVNPDSPPHAVVSPITFNEKLFSGDKNRIIMQTERRYNTVLKRPRRNRIVIAPSSILMAPEKHCTISWKGFREKIREMIPQDRRPTVLTDKVPFSAIYQSEITGSDLKY